MFSKAERWRLTSPGPSSPGPAAYSPVFTTRRAPAFSCGPSQQRHKTKQAGGEADIQERTAKDIAIATGGCQTSGGRRVSQSLLCILEGLRGGCKAPLSERLLIEPGLEDKDREGLRAEAQLLYSLQQAGGCQWVKKAIGITCDEDVVCGILLELLADNLRARSLCADFTPAELLNAFADACKASRFLHQHLVSHNDIKPSNLAKSKVGESFKVIDFDAARQLKDWNQRCSQFAGTLFFASPECLPLQNDCHTLGLSFADELATDDRLGRDKVAGMLDLSLCSCAKHQCRQPWLPCGGNVPSHQVQAKGRGVGEKG